MVAINIDDFNMKDEENRYIVTIKREKKEANREQLVTKPIPQVKEELNTIKPSFINKTKQFFKKFSNIKELDSFIFPNVVFQKMIYNDSITQDDTVNSDLQNNKTEEIQKEKLIEASKKLEELQQEIKNCTKENEPDVKINATEGIGKSIISTNAGPFLNTIINQIAQEPEVEQISIAPDSEPVTVIREEVKGIKEQTETKTKEIEITQIKEKILMSNFDETEIAEINHYIVSNVPFSVLNQLYILTDISINKAKAFVAIYRILTTAKNLITNQKLKDKLNLLLKDTNDSYKSLLTYLIQYESSNLNFSKNAYLNKINDIFSCYESNLEINKLIDMFLVFAEKQTILDMNKVTGIDLETEEGKKVYTDVQSSFDNK